MFATYPVFGVGFGVFQFVSPSYYRRRGNGRPTRTIST